VQSCRDHRGGEPPGTAHDDPLLRRDALTAAGLATLRLHGLNDFRSSRLVGTLISPEITFWRSASTFWSASALLGMSIRTSAMPTPPSLSPMVASPLLKAPLTTSLSVS